jgi:hypothetical protein
VSWLRDVLLRLYGPKAPGRPVLTPVLLPAILVNSIPTPGET